MEKFNITKYIAYCGLCSRRDAEDMVINGQVKVNDKVEANLTRNIDDYDVVTINGININFINEVKLYVFYKPKGCIVSREDDKGRKTIFDLIPKSLPRLISVGRLDFNSEGLLLLTNYGPLARYFELPENKIERVYEVKVFGNWKDEFITRLQNGIKIDRFQYKPIMAKILTRRDKQIKVECRLQEGKNLELRKIFNHFDLLVSKLKRTSYGYFHLGKIPQGELIECKKHVVDRVMKEAQLTLKK